MGHTDTVKMQLDAGEHPPIKMKPYRTPLNKRAVIDNAVDEMLEAGIIRKSRPPWSFPVVVVDKKDGSKRFCVDFRQLNKITKPISYPLPVIDDILARLGTTTRSRWSVTFVMDLNPYVTVMSTVGENINHLLGVIRTVVENRAPGSNGLVNDFRGLSNELETLRETYFGVNAQLAAYHALHPRNKRSLVPFTGQAFSFLFGTVSGGDLGAIRRNLHILMINQVVLAHVVQESLYLINISRARIAENRQTLNLIVSGMGAINEQIANVTQKLDNRIFQ